MNQITRWGDIARGAQEQIATFFESDGEMIIHPEPARFFEVPIVRPLPEDLSYTITDGRVVGADGGGNPDIDASQIYFSGISAGTNYGALLLAVSPDLVGGVLSSVGSSGLEIGRISPAARGNRAGFQCAVRTPSLINPNGLTESGGIPVQPPFFNENKPFRDQPILVNDVPGALAIQALFENVEWVNQQGDSGAFAPHIRKMPLNGVGAKPLIIQIAKGDQSIPNPRESAFVRAGDFADVTTYHGNDLLFADHPNVQKNPHGFLVLIDIPADAPQSAAAQDQVGTFFASRGPIIIHPEPVQYWEVPIQSALPEDLSLILDQPVAKLWAPVGSRRQASRRSKSSVRVQLGR